MFSRFPLGVRQSFLVFMDSAVCLSRPPLHWSISIWCLPIPWSRRLSCFLIHPPWFLQNRERTTEVHGGFGSPELWVHCSSPLCSYILQGKSNNQCNDPSSFTNWAHTSAAPPFPGGWRAGRWEDTWEMISGAPAPEGGVGGFRQPQHGDFIPFSRPFARHILSSLCWTDRPWGESVAAKSKWPRPASFQGSGADSCFGFLPHPV